MLGGDGDDDMADMGDGPTTNNQVDDWARILTALNGIDRRFLDCKRVEKLDIDFEHGYACSIDAVETITTSSASTTPKSVNKRVRSDNQGPTNQIPLSKKKKVI
ncbi:unnamed protein product [Adineta steineri]|uniref:Uncharacterized protein n=1 Tax=Adineta steineri TaxID=433720 RepID=A0A814H424_9BILA|nr:unnamed protein product [Adineta steineri]CAF3599545.1 unnamed protein product [Adineta steineri]